MLVKVAVELKFDSGKDVLDYILPPELIEKAQIGARVAIPLGKGNRLSQGYIVGFASKEEINYKSVAAVLEDEPLLNEELVELALWVSHHYLCSCYYVLEYILPKYARQKEKITYHWLNAQQLYHNHMIFFDDMTIKVVEDLKKRDCLEGGLLKKYGPRAKMIIADLLEKGLVERKQSFAETGGYSHQFYYSSLLTPEQLEEEWVQKQVTRSAKQKALLHYLTFEGTRDGNSLRQFWPNYLDLFRALEKKQLVKKEQVMVERHNQVADVFNNKRVLQLNEEQLAALETLDAFLEKGAYQPVLIHGVTSSGKTEIYLRAIETALRLGKGAMVLVPEIALTPQLIGRFRGMLGEQVDVLHSGLSDGERHDVWQKLRSGKLKVIVGVRSAVFAPVQNLGLIIIDEEHETTFKQSEPDPRYHARDVALVRAKMKQAVVVLGSATPSVESFYHGMQGDYQMIYLKRRALQQPFPEVEIVDMAMEFKMGNRQIFSRSLVLAMEESISRGEQVILFLNRRGFSSSVLCRECGHTMMCEKCAIALTYHKQQNLLKCHYCDYRIKMPNICPKCGSKFIRHFGSGTEQVEEELLKKWPWLKVLRMDMDTTQHKNAHQDILAQFAKNEAQILIGTQMVTKGLDFPNVTTVGVVAADLTLNMPDYTASERTFQLLTQVAGRAGRGDKLGKVVIQTYNPEHHSLLMGKTHDYNGFYAHEIKNRELMNYPPFSVMVRILVSDYGAKEAMEMINLVADYFHKTYPDLALLGPAEAPIGKIRDRYRFHLILKGEDLELLINMAKDGQRMMNVSRKSKTLRIVIDVEPQSIL